MERFFLWKICMKGLASISEKKERNKIYALFACSYIGGGASNPFHFLFSVLGKGIASWPLAKEEASKTNYPLYQILKTTLMRNLVMQAEAYNCSITIM